MASVFREAAKRAQNGEFNNMADASAFVARYMNVATGKEWNEFLNALAQSVAETDDITGTFNLVADALDQNVESVESAPEPVAAPEETKEPEETDKASPIEGAKNVTEDAPASDETNKEAPLPAPPVAPVQNCPSGNCPTSNPYYYPWR